MSSAKKYIIGEDACFTPVKKLSLVELEAKDSPEVPHEEIETLREDVYENKNGQSLEFALQHLWKLDKLERLIYLTELEKLDKLDKLDALSQLDQLDVIQELKHLKELKELSHLEELKGLGHLTELSHLKDLEKLDSLKDLSKLAWLEQLDVLDSIQELKHLKELKQLSQLQELKGLDQLSQLIHLKDLGKLDSLKELSHLQQMDMLEMLKQLDKLTTLNKLDELKKLDKLDNLTKVGELKFLLEAHGEDFNKFSLLSKLDKLDKLENLKQLENLGQLSDLEQLTSLVKLDRLIELRHLERLSSLDNLHKLERLDDLAKLERLSKLDQLQFLEKLDNMQDLTKLDRLNDEEIRQAFKHLEKLDYFKGTNKSFIAKITLSSFFDVFKVFAVASCLVFLFTKNVSYQTFNRLAPYIGFGEADRVNIALSILSQDLGSSEFDKMFKDLEFRVKREASTLFDPFTPKGLNEYRIAENLLAYNYVSKNYDLAALSKKERSEWSDQMLKKFNNSYEYDLERLMNEATLQEDLKIYREASVFMKQQKYVESFGMFSRIQHPKKFEALGFGRSYVFYMAFLNQPKELKTILEK